MNIKRVMIVGTMVVAMSFGTTTWNKPLASASPVAKWSTSSVADSDDLLDALNQSSDEELYESLYEGKSLADIATEQHRDINGVIELQIAQLSRQLNVRLAEGSITAQQHADHMAELNEIVTRSVFTSFG
ncbi:hypothetical protein [Paenibacillus sp. sgz500958]|uniref:hypothetical protein n=1 Tax=Paenibacillus sp. sgz500958 TaxID=3242475 RepID=UPI0036D3BFD6